MKKIKNKFIIGVILVIIFILSFQLYKYYDLYRVDTNSYALLVNGKGEVNNKTLYQNEKTEIKMGDEIKTIGESSILILEWGDRSITRLGGNTRVVVKENFISKDLTKINIAFNLLNGKTWSNVINFMGKDSYFKEYFNDIEAGVRGTVFDVNLDKNYIFVSDHEVSLKTKNGKTYKIGENKPFSIKTLNFIDLQKFLINFKDKAWEKFNKKFDKKLIDKLKNSLQNSLKNNKQIRLLSNIDIKSLNLKEKEKAYNDLLSKYQKYNFVTPTDEKLFKMKMKIKSSLLSLANKDNKKDLLKTVVYDINDAISSNKDKLIENILPIIKKYKNIIPNIDINKLKKVNEQINNFIGGSGNNITNKLKGFVEGAGEKIGGKVNNLLDNLKK